MRDALPDPGSTPGVSTKLLKSFSRRVRALRNRVGRAAPCLHQSDPHRVSSTRLGRRVSESRPDENSEAKPRDPRQVKLRNQHAHFFSPRAIEVIDPSSRCLGKVSLRRLERRSEPFERCGRKMVRTKPTSARRRMYRRVPSAPSPASVDHRGWAHLYLISLFNNVSSRRSSCRRSRF